MTFWNKIFCGRGKDQEGQFAGGSLRTQGERCSSTVDLPEHCDESILDALLASHGIPRNVGDMRVFAIQIGRAHV